MNALSSLFRANPGLVVAAALCVGLALVLGLLALLLRGAGASLRPAVFLMGLMLPLALVFLVGTLVGARQPGPQPERIITLTVRDGRFEDRTKLFGADLPESQVRDAKAVFPEFFGEAEHAELGIIRAGETVLAAQFPTPEQAKRVAAFLWRTFQMTGTSGDETKGWRGYRRLNSDYIEMLRTGRQVFFWTGPTREAAATLRAASFLNPAAVEQATPEGPAPLVPTLQPLGVFFHPVGMKVAGLLVVAALYAGWFFKGAAWAGSTPAAPGVTAVSPTELTARLESINALDAPFRIERGRQAGEYFATWRYADAKWIDAARIRGLRRTFRIRLQLDDAARVVRATDFFAAHDWSAGATGASIAWQASLGIVFFQSEHSRVFGLQLDERGRFKPEPSYAYQFNLQEMKAPLIQAVTRAGWTWRPVVWQGPAWLRWLTE